MSPDDLEALKTLDLSQVMLSGTIDPATGNIGHIDAPGAHAKLQAVLLDRKVPRIDTVIFPDIGDIRNHIKERNEPLFSHGSEWNERIHFARTITDVVTLLRNEVETQKHATSFSDLEKELPTEDDLVGREWLFEIVNGFLQDPHGGYLLLTAPPGFGKSAITKLLWERLHQREQLPPVDGSTGFEGESIDVAGRRLEVAVALCVIKRGVADGPARMVAKLTAQIRKSLRLPSREPELDASNSTKLAGVLKAASDQLESHQRLVILWDGFDEAFGPEGSFSGLPLVTLLPASLPSNVKIIVTTRPGTTVESLSFLSNKQPVDLEKDHVGQRGDIRKFLNQENDRRRLQLSQEFLVRLADVTEGVFAAARLFFDDPDLSEWQRDSSRLPKGLDGWLEKQWLRLMQPLLPTTGGTQNRPEPEVMQVVLGFLATLREPLSEDSLDLFFTALESYSAGETFPSVAGVSLDKVGVQLSKAVNFASNLFCWPREGRSRNSLLRFFHGRFAEFIREKLTSRQRRNIDRLLARFCQDRWQDNRRWFHDYALNNAVWHLLDAGGEDVESFAWDALETMLCDWRYIGAKRNADRLDGLRAEYAHALAAWPDPIEQQRREKEQQRQLTLREYTRDLIEHARDPDHVPLPPPPPLVEMEAGNEVTERTPGDWRPVEKVQAWSQTLAHNSANLQDPQIPVFQTAYNAFENGPVAEQMQKLLDAEETPQRPWLLLRNRPQFLLHPAYERTLEGHGNVVNSVAVTLDGARAISGSSDWTVKLWDLESGQCLRTLEGHGNAVRSVAVTPDGVRAVSGSDDLTVKVWDLESGQCLKTLEGHGYGYRVGVVRRDGVRSVAVTPDGALAVSGGDDRTVKVWDLESGQCLMTLEGHGNVVCSVAVTPDGTRAVSASTDSTVKVWDLARGQCLMTLEGAGDIIHSVVVTPDGIHAVSGSGVESPHRAWQRRHEPDSERRVLGSPAVKIWDLASGQCRVTLEGHFGSVYSVAVTPDCARAVSGDGTVKMWDLASGQCLVTLEGQINDACSVAVTPDVARAVSGGHRDNTVKMWDLMRGRPLRSLKGLSECESSLAVTLNGSRAVSVSGNGTAKVWDLESGQCLMTHRGADEFSAMLVPCVAVTPDGTHAVSGSGDVWDLASGQRRMKLYGNVGTVLSVAVTPDGMRTVLASSDGKLKVFSLSSGQCLMTLDGNVGAVFSVAVTPDGTRAVSGDGSTVKMWDLESGQCLMTLDGHVKLASSVAVTPDGTRAVSAGNDGTLKVWNLVSGQCLKTLKGADEWVRSLAVTPDGTRAVSWSLDETVKVWDLVSGDCIAVNRFRNTWGSAVVAIPKCTIVVGMPSGKVEILTLEGLVDVPAFVTPTRVWHFGRGEELGRWDDTLTIHCPFCGTRFPASRDLCGQHISCEHCKAALRVNHFVCDVKNALP